MPLDTSSTALGSAANANADAGGAYSSALNVDDNTGSQIAGDYANGKATVDTTYSGAQGDANKMTASCAAIYGGFCQAFDPNATLAQKATGLLEIEAGIAGVCYLAAEAVAALGISTVVIDGATGLTIAAAIPIVGWVAAIAIVIVVAAVVIFDAVVPVAQGNPVPWTDEDQARYVIAQMLEKMPTPALPGAPFTDASRTLASLGASYVQAQLAAATPGLPPTAAMVNAPTGSAFGYKSGVAASIHELINVQVGGDAKTDAFLSILSVLWDPRWRGSYEDEVGGNAGLHGNLGVSMELDPSNPQNILGGTMNLVTLKKQSVTDETGLPAASYLCEVAAAAFLANLNNPAGHTYAAVYIRLCQTAWFYKACQDADGKTPIAVPSELLATIGFMLDAAVQNGASTSNPLLTTNNAVLKTAVKPTANLGLTAASRDLNYWVHYYLALGGAA